MGEALRLLKEENREADTLTIVPAHLAKLIELTENGTINQTAAKEVFAEIFHHNTDPELYVKEHELTAISDEGALREAVQGVLEANPQSVADYRGGKEKALGYLVGQTMKQMKGKADPGTVNRLLRELL